MEGKLREEIIDMKLYEMSLKRFQEIDKFDVKNQGISLLDPNSMIENIIKFEVRSKFFYLLFFDDGQVFLTPILLEIFERFSYLIKIFNTWKPSFLLTNIQVN